MKHFDKPFCEVIRFSDVVITGSNCGCWDGVMDWGQGANCKGDNPNCSCKVNYNPAGDNCINPD